MSSFRHVRLQSQLQSLLETLADFTFSFSDEPTAPRSPSPQWNEARSSHTHDTQPVLAQLNTFNLRTPSSTLDFLDSATAEDGDDDDGDAIPIPVPRSQGSPVSSPVPTFPPRSPLIEVRSPHSYGYGHVSPRSPPTPASTPSKARPAALARPAPTRFPPPVSTISTTASPSSNRRFAAPLPFTRIEKESVLVRASWTMHDTMGLRMSVLELTSVVCIVSSM
ncbi:hypothetical protein Hypma_009949 [Hypsizygus marmoreus]|uniref:Uncharacterized protein n=1 Tax=Hypsizygus marmoreus TaxID=39966 RepID=A0A369JUS8_HYPMA|nr:hypothetical protein Hypma_009949 [Hypsizygus marmoreus]